MKLRSSSRSRIENYALAIKELTAQLEELDKDIAHHTMLCNLKRSYRTMLRDSICDAHTHTYWHYMNEGERRRGYFYVTLTPEESEASEDLEELRKYIYGTLWENYALRSTSPYGCTGQYLTSSFSVAHVKDNIWKVCETQSLDV